MAATPLSRRASEFLGVALFAAALIWLISLASYNASDPVWFFNTGSDLPPANFAGRVGAFVGELSYQMLGYSAYLVPLVLVVLGWHYFWCRAVDAAYTKMLGAALLFGCISSFLSLAFGALDVGGKEFRAGGVVGDRLAALLAEYLNRTGSIILILTLLFAAIILSTQFSFGRLFGTLSQMARERWTAMIDARAQRKEEKAREKQRQEVLKKHLGKDTKESKDTKDTKEREPLVVARAKAAASPSNDPSAPSMPSPPSTPAKSKTAALVGAAAAALKAAASKPTPPPIRKPVPVAMKDAKEPAPAAPEPEKVERRRAPSLPPHALLDAPKARQIDERGCWTAHGCSRRSPRVLGQGTVVQIHPGPVVTTYEFKPDADVSTARSPGSPTICAWRCRPSR
jgi:S-DNA-T family DNA segregation ATPase FtsK/SpoIIIE